MPWDVSVMLDDRPGALAELAGSAAEAGVNLASVCAVSEGRGLAHLLVDEGLHVAQVLEAAGHEVVATREVLLVPIENRPGALAEVCDRMAKEGVNLDLVYVAREDRLVLAVDQPEKARSVI